MRRVRQAVAAVLLALWLPATLHCELEWAGLFGDCAGCHETGALAGQDQDADSCATVEDGFSPPTPVVLVKTPLTLWVTLLVQTPPAPRVALAGPSARTVAPPELVCTWHFAERAAPPSRAPSSRV